MKIWQHDTQSVHCTEIPTVSWTVFINTTRAWLWPSEFCQERGGGGRYKLILTLNKRLQSTRWGTTTTLAVWQNGSIHIMLADPFQLYTTVHPFLRNSWYGIFINSITRSLESKPLETEQQVSFHPFESGRLPCVLWREICYGQIWFLCSSCCFTFRFFHIISHWCNRQSS